MNGNKLFFDHWCEVHRKVNESLKTRWADEAFSFLDEILEAAKKEFARPDVFLLPKTPSAKRKGTRRKKLSQSSCHDDSTASSVAESCMSEEGEESSGKRAKKSSATQATRSTRASARTTRATKKKASMEEPIMSLINNSNFENTAESETEAGSKQVSAKEKTISKTNKKAKHSTELHNSSDDDKVSEKELSGVENLSEEESEVSQDSEQSISHEISKDTESADAEESYVEVIEEWTQNIDTGTLDPANALETPQRTVVECHRIRTPVSKTPIQNFNHMNVKEKVQAYEEIVLISPLHHSDRDKSSENTPATAGRPSSAKTPDTVASNKVARGLTPTNETSDRSESVESPTKKRKSEHTDTPKRRTHSRKSFRESLRTSLHILPSKEKEMKKHLEVPNKPIKRTRLRLKKTNKEEQAEQEMDAETSSSQEEMVTDNQATDSCIKADQESTRSNEATGRATRATKKRASREEPVLTMVDNDNLEKTAESLKAQTGKNSSDGEMPPEEPLRVASSTRTKTRQASKKDNLVVAEPAEEVTREDPKSPAPQPAPVRSTRTKTRAQQHAQMPSMPVEEQHRKDSGIGGSVSSQPDDTRPRVTRSKMRKPTEDQAHENVFACPTGPVPQGTRTKTRKRQLEGGTDDESRSSKRSCTGSLSDDLSNTPTKIMTTDEESSDGEYGSPMCPAEKGVHPHPKSFLNNLKSSANPVRPANALTGGLVKSFIAKNSPKPTAKDIREKQKKELLEKQKKNEERLKKRQDEYKKRMEEMKKKREEKMKKVQQLREQKKQEDQENRLQLEKRLAEKRQLTNKLREERLREEKEKQKLRMQKFEEAEERRKQEESERKKKLQEQMKNEKSHEAFLQRKKEFEEQERQRKIEEEKQKTQERQQDLEREREKERDRLRQLEDERQREWQKKKEDRDRQVAQEKADRERMEMEKKREKDLQMKAEMEKIREQERVRLLEQEKLKDQQRRQEEESKKMVDKHNSQVSQGQTQGQLPKPNLNKTHSLNEPTVQHPRTNSYEMTPDKVPQKSTDPENYNIDDLDSGDETDDEDCPRKAIPSWAQGSHLKTLLIKQHYNPPDLDKLFDYIEVPDLNALFEKKKARFNKRTSSAHWDTPILKPSTLDRV